ncbi:uncharacterized protein Z519_12325 [Cladophialophora bantiana CBS 173.52]|uniref:DRBM domain-containing protein n=1 Tax=Cladophialophora bantiana (strain ATCC 10958 / CBS 173.52 / CDC B-1940 / NIH 8579) TaxID=1442370 RepID=A0A0D2H1D4_CLAB1|nr:uncharacterized protein Z519_12325 [Cladophialophora bantiana CBS 173.52]KIW87028.1 hypothetical protein Z519_12325 [Cladophialophora bantiana CBS 173.52]
MAFAASELPADSAVGNTSLFGSNEITQKDGWLGEKYLEYALAHLLLRHTPDSHEIISLNGSLFQELAGFRYDNLCRQLRNNGVRQYRSPAPGHFQGHVNFREDAVCWIGAIVRRGTKNERAILDHAIVDNSDSHSPTFNSTTDITTSAQTVVTNQEESPDEEPTSTDSESDIWLYTNTLQERFAGKDVVPIYEETMIRRYPPRFRAVVTFRGKNFSGEAGNKKLAKHRASKKLCGAFEIEVREP